MCSHLSRSAVTGKIQQPTTEEGRAALFHASTWSCSEWGLHDQLVTKLPVSSYLAFPPLPAFTGGISLLHYP